MKAKSKKFIIKRGEFIKEVSAVIAQHGRQIVAVIPDGDEMAFAYTIGNHSKGLPELLMIGPSSYESASLLNWLSDQMVKQKKAFGDGCRVYGSDNTRPFAVWDASDEAKRKYTIQVGQYYETEDYALQQVVIPDEEGRYPGDKECDEPYNSVPIMKAQQRTVH